MQSPGPDPSGVTPLPRPWPEGAALPPASPLALTDLLRKRLAEVRARQMADHRAGRPRWVGDVFIDKDVVCLRAGGGHGVYLGLDGRLYYQNIGDGLQPECLVDPREVASALVKFAANINLPELLNQIAARPADGVVCAVCSGTRRMSAEVYGRPDDPPVCCLRCRGLGWTLA